MYHVKITRTGPPDKMLINGRPFASAFTNTAKMIAWYRALAGVQNTTLDISTPGKIVRIISFDTEANRTASGLKEEIGTSTDPHGLCNDLAGYIKYIKDNNINSPSIELYND